VAGMNKHYNKRFADLLRVLGKDFDRHVIEDPDFSARIPPKAHIIIQLEVPENVDLRLRREVELFNRWAMDLALKQSEPGEKIVVAVRRLAPLVALASDNLNPTFLEQARGEYALQTA